MSSTSDSQFPIGATRAESVEDIRRAIAAQTAATAAAAARGAQESAGPVLYRPVRRPPMALLCILDDGQDDGELIRLRADRTVIGRTEGDVLIPHDSSMSARHAEVVRTLDRGRQRWQLRDLRSSNGMFIRTGRAVLQDRQELLIGGRRLRFHSAQQGAELAEAADASEGTAAWESVSAADLIPSLVEVKPTGEGQRWFLKDDDLWVGSDSRQCQVVLADDLLVSPRHARLFRDPQRHWVLENAGSLNGVWVRLGSLTVQRSCQFQLGEQRFSLRTLG